MSQPSASLTIRAEIAAKIGNFGRVMAAIGDAGAEVGGVDIVRSGPTSITRDISVGIRDAEHADAVVAAVNALDGVTVEQAMDRVTLAHVGGKMTMKNRAELTSRDDLSMAYTPGVARVCMAIHHDPDRTWDLTIRGNSVAVVSDGSAVAGQGALGALAALPSAEAKCGYMVEMGSIDGFPLPLDVTATDEIINVVSKITSVFGGVHLADISDERADAVAPALRDVLDIPVLHEEADAIGAVALAAAINGAQVAGTTIDQTTVAVLGDGPTATTIRRLVGATGATVAADLADAAIAIAAGDAGVSLDQARELGESGVVIATGAIDPGLATEVTLASTRVDLPNQVDAALAYPGIWRGALDCRATRLSDEMLVAAAHAIAGTCAGAVAADYILPSVLNPDLAAAVANAVRDAAVASGAARLLGTSAT